MASTSSSLPMPATDSNYFFGWDLLYRSIEKSVVCNTDVLIALTHYILVRHYNMRNVGVGEDKTLSDDAERSELLPHQWNNDSNKYSLRYAHENKLYLLFGHMSAEILILNLLDVETKKVSNVVLDPKVLVEATKGTIFQMIPTASEVVDKIRNDLIEQVFKGRTKAATTQTGTTIEPRSDDHFDPLRIGEPRHPMRPFRPSGIDVGPPFGFPEVGRGDLDPLGRGGPGNLLAFPSRPDFRGGAQPRFDPYGPEGPNIRPNPNPDHLPPPNFGDDFYM